MSGTSSSQHRNPYGKSYVPGVHLLRCSDLVLSQECNNLLWYGKPCDNIECRWKKIHTIFDQKMHFKNFENGKHFKFQTAWI